MAWKRLTAVMKAFERAQAVGIRWRDNDKGWMELSASRALLFVLDPAGQHDLFPRLEYDKDAAQTQQVKDF